MKEVSFEIIEHTADIGIRVKSLTLTGLFKCAGLAIADISSQKQKLPNILKSVNPDMLLKELESKGIIMKASGRNTLLE